MTKSLNAIVLAFILAAPAAFAQTVKDANLYPTNLEENMYFKGYDAPTRTLRGMHFEVYADGENSRWVTPAFTVKLYLYQEGKAPIFFRTFEEEGIYQMGKKVYDLDVSLADLDAAPGTYRVGVLVNADQTVKEKASDNAMLFRDAITLGKSSANSVTAPLSGQPDTPEAAPDHTEAPDKDE